MSEVKSWKVLNSFAYTSEIILVELDICSRLYIIFRGTES